LPHPVEVSSRVYATVFYASVASIIYSTPC